MKTNMGIEPGVNLFRFEIQRSFCITPMSENAMMFQLVLKIFTVERVQKKGFIIGRKYREITIDNDKITEDYPSLYLPKTKYYTFNTTFCWTNLHQAYRSVVTRAIRYVDKTAKEHFIAELRCSALYGFFDKNHIRSIQVTDNRLQLENSTTALTTTIPPKLVEILDDVFYNQCKTAPISCEVCGEVLSREGHCTSGMFLCYGCNLR